MSAPCRLALPAAALCGLLFACAPGRALIQPGDDADRPIASPAGLVALPRSGRLVTEAEACRIARVFLAEGELIAKLVPHDPETVERVRAVARRYREILSAPSCGVPLPVWIAAD